MFVLLGVGSEEVGFSLVKVDSYRIVSTSLLLTILECSFSVLGVRFLDSVRRLMTGFSVIASCFSKKC